LDQVMKNKTLNDGGVISSKPKPKSKAQTQIKPPPVLDRGAPMHSARILMAEHFVANNMQTLWRHREAFWLWNGSYYQLAGNEMLRTRVWNFLDRALRLEKGSSVPIPFDPTPQLVSAVIDALGAVCNLNEHTEPPVWLTPGPRKPAPVELVACANGLLHLPTGKLYPASPDLFCVSASKVKYDRKAKAPQWDKFLNALFAKDRQSKKLLQHWFGYTLSPDMSQQKIAGLIGPPRSGKGTIARILTDMLGTTSVAGPTMHSLGTDFGLEPLITTPLAIISDVRTSRHTNSSIVVERLLSISGEDRITVPRKHTKAWHGKLPTRITFLSNELLALTDSAGALTSRLMMLMLTESFLGREDTELTNKLKKELSGILNWAIAGYRSHSRQPAISPSLTAHLKPSSIWKSSNRRSRHLLLASV
jgi:putative DNA primase/helicase